MRLPEYNMARGAATLASIPPFDFHGVTMRVFPLAAHVDRIADFVDEYLNMGVPEEICRFEPSVPYVYFMVINYGKMSSKVAHSGWVAQNEIGFAVLLDKYRLKNGKKTLVGQVTFFPFIFVDDPSSQATGREVYGWPKIECRFTSRVSTWTKDPRLPYELACVSAPVFPDASLDRREEPRIVLQVFQEAELSVSEFPARAENPVNPLIAGPRILMSALAGVADMADMGWASNLRGYAPSSSGSANPSQRFRQALSRVAPMGKSPTFRCLNYKQFRDAKDPSRACYQALIESEMHVARVNAGGLLGDSRIALGDRSGGYSIRVHRYASLPIIERLGIDIATQSRGHSVAVALLKPVFPMWINLDLNYGTGDITCWRDGRGPWKARDEACSDAHPRRWVSFANPHVSKEEASSEGEALHPFNTALGASQLTSVGPFRFPDARMRVLPLLADPLRLTAFCDAYLNDNFAEPDALDEGAVRPHFEPMGSYVYLIVESYRHMSGGDDDLGAWAQRGVRFSIPVRMYSVPAGWQPPDDPVARRHELARRNLSRVGLVSPYVYYDTQRATETAREVLGWPADLATIEGPPTNWVASDEPADLSRELHVSTQVLSAMNVDQSMQTRPLLEITRGNVLDQHDDEAWRAVAGTWGRDLKGELKRRPARGDGHTHGERRNGGGFWSWLASVFGFASHDDAARASCEPRPEDPLRTLKSLALEVLANKRAINGFALKQFRHSEKPKRACYQAIVESRTVIERLHDLREIESLLHVCIHKHASQPIVSTLGLKVKSTQVTDAGVVYVLEPLRPFWMRVDLRTEPGENLCSRTEERWSTALGSGYFEEKSLARVPEAVVAEIEKPPAADTPGAGAPSAQAVPCKQRVVERVRDHVDGCAAATVSEEERRAMRHAVEEMEPQFAIESILSHEWQHCGAPRWKRCVSEPEILPKPDFCVRRDSVGSAADAFFPVAKGQPTYTSGTEDLQGWYALGSEPPASPAPGGRPSAPPVTP